MKGSIEALSPFIPAKDNTDNALPDVFISHQDWENPRDTFDHQVVILNAKSKKKQQFWWDYLKLNIFLSDLEYKFGYYVLMNRWQVPVIQKWIAEYHEKGYFEIPAGKRLPSFLFESQRKSTGSHLKLHGSTG